VTWVAESESAAVSFGYATVADEREFRQRIHVHNFANVGRTYAVTMDLRDPSSPGVAAADVRVPSTIRVPAHETREFEARIELDPSKLPTWILNGGSRGGRGDLLTQLELDGHIKLSDGTDTVRLPWQFLPH
jgi:hypothetical protein